MGAPFAPIALVAPFAHLPRGLDGDWRIQSDAEDGSLRQFDLLAFGGRDRPAAADHRSEDCAFEAAENSTEDCANAGALAFWS